MTREPTDFCGYCRDIKENDSPSINSLFATNSHDMPAQGKINLLEPALDPSEGE